MKLTPLRLPGLFLLEGAQFDDERGFFARIWEAEALAAAGLQTAFNHCSLSFNPQQGTLRGLHFQQPPLPEVKVVRCSRGAMYDVVVDIRPGSPTYLQWEAVELSAGDLRSLYIPPGMAHGFQTLRDETEVFYMIGAPYQVHLQSGLRYDDPKLAIPWPLPVSKISERDQGWPYLEKMLEGASCP